MSADLFRCVVCLEVQKKAAPKKRRPRAGDRRSLWCWRCARTTRHVVISKTKKGLRT